MGTLYKDSYYFLLGHFRAVFKIFGPFSILTAILSPFIASWNVEYPSFWNSLLYSIVTGLVYTYLTVLFIKYMASVTSGKPIPLTVSLTEWHNLIVAYIAVGIIAMAGVVALIIPGLIVLARYSFIEFEVVLNGKGPFKALGISWVETRGSTLKLMGIGLIMVLSTYILDGVLTLIAIYFPALDIICTLLFKLLKSVVTIFTSIVFFRAYVTNTVEKPLTFDD